MKRDNAQNADRKGSHQPLTSNQSNNLSNQNNSDRHKRNHGARHRSRARANSSLTGLEGQKLAENAFTSGKIITIVQITYRLS